MRLPLTDLQIKAIKAPEKGQVTYFDSRLPCFGLRISQGGRKTWVVVYRYNVRKRWLTLGTYPTLSLADAREGARLRLADVQHGVDPAAEKRQKRLAETFGELAAEYLERHAKPRKRTWKEDDRIIKRDLLPVWRHRKAAEISRRDVARLLDGIAERGAAIMANRTLALVSRIFTFGVSREIVEQNPAYRMPKPGVERQRERCLAEAEIATVWQVLDREPSHIGAIFRLALLTAARRGEVCGLRWPELDLDLDAGCWIVPAERSKNGLEHRIPLTPEAVAVLKRIRENQRDSTFVFRGGKRGQPIANLQKPMLRIKAASGVDFRFHDIRRTVATSLASLGVPRLVVSKLLNHVDDSVTAIYERHRYDKEKRAALLRWERRLMQIVERAPVAESGAAVLRSA
ncbi:MAG TPA: tyrosine-type recombinase/integrase [Candidatus Binataceae bacterium]|nr:tyrosine-type recombinase/integrase [Candidatus Binataceae bacterium]